MFGFLKASAQQVTLVDDQGHTLHTRTLEPKETLLNGALRHGIIRLAAHQHRERETSGPGPLPPAAIAALWRPWRRMRMA